MYLIKSKYIYISNFGVKKKKCLSIFQRDLNTPREREHLLTHSKQDSGAHLVRQNATQKLANSVGDVLTAVDETCGKKKKMKYFLPIGYLFLQHLNKQKKGRNITIDGYSYNPLIY